MPVWCDLNINDKVRFRLNPEGERIWREYWAPYSGGRDALLNIPADNDGWRSEQLWQIAQVFGSHFSCGLDCPIETVIRVQVPDRLVGFE